VLASDVFDAISEFVRRGTLDQLVVYFSGHGFLSSPSTEFWLLSNAPDNPNEAVSLIESAIRAKTCGIPNVVFISDACRSRADSIRALGVRGSLIFPTVNITQPRTDVDKFLATLAGDPALEMLVDNSSAEFEGIYTSCFLDAYRNPDQVMIKHLSPALAVVPNRNVNPCVEREVRRRVEAKSKTLRQNQTPKSTPQITYISGEFCQTKQLSPLCHIETLQYLMWLAIS
jgi:Caspase domain